MFCPDPRHLALGGDDHRRHAVRPVAPRGDRVLLLSRRADSARGGRLRYVEKPRALRGAGSADVRGRPRRRLRLRFHRHPLADSLRRDPRLPAVRVVPDRVRRGGAADGLLRLGELENLKNRDRPRFSYVQPRKTWSVPDYPCTQGRPAFLQPPTLLRCCWSSLSPSKPSSTL